MFNCSKCGICCQHINTPEIESINGVCINYDKETKLCKIYETRPLICRVDEGYSLFEKELSKDDYYKENYAACMRLRKGMIP